MGGPIHGRIECVSRANTLIHGTQEMFTTLYHFLKQHKTLESIQYGTGGTGDGYWDDVNPVGLSGHFGSPAFAVFKFPASASRKWYWQLVLQYGSNMDFGSAPADPGALNSSSSGTGIGIGACMAYDGTGTEFDPWLGFKRTDGRAHKLCPWSSLTTYNTGDRVMYQAAIYSSNIDGNLNLVPPNVNWTLLQAAPTAWSAATYYQLGDCVTYLNVFYYCVQTPNFNITPSSSAAYWQSCTGSQWGFPLMVPSTGKVYSMPRSNNTPLGYHGGMKNNISKLAAGSAGGSYTGSMHLFCDDDALVILVSEQGAAGIPTYSVCYFGPYTPLHGQQPTRPFVAFGTDAYNKVYDPLSTSQIYGGVVGGATSWGGIITAKYDVRDVSLDRYYGIQGDVYNEPSFLVTPTEMGEYPVILRVNETIGDAYFPRGIVGKIDSPLLRFSLGGPIGRLSMNKRRISVAGGYYYVGSSAVRFTVPWDGGATFIAAGGSRYGTDFTL